MAQPPPGGGGGRGTPLSMADMMSLQTGGQGMRPNAQAAWQQQQQQQQQRTVSPAGGQPGGVLNAAQLQLLQAANPGLLQNPNLQQQLALQALLMQQQQRQQQQQQQQAGRGGGHKQAAAGLGGPGGMLQMQALQGLQGGGGGMRRHGSGVLPSPGGGGYGGGRGPGGGGPSALGRPLGSGGPLMGAGSSGAAGSAVNAKVTAALDALRGGEPPKVEPPDGHEWVQCISRTTGKPEWYAVPRARAQTMRLAQQAGGGGKRNADGSLTGQPPHKAAHTAGGGRGGGRGARDDVSVIENDVLQGVTDVAADMSQSSAARVVAEQGNVQEDYLLNQGPTMAAVARAAREGGVKAVSESVYPYLSLAAEAYLVQLLHSLAKMRLQREDLGKAYAGAEKLDDRLRGGLFAIQKREREAARKREEEQRDELAKLGATRKKLAEEDKKAAKAAQNARQLQQQQKNLGSTLQMMGIGRRAFAMGSLARPAAAAAAGSSKAGLTKPELLEAKAAAAAEDEQQPAAAAAAAAAAPGGADNTAAAANGAPGAGPADAAAAASAVSGGAADGGGDEEDMGEAGPLLKPMSLAHQLVSASQPGGGAGVPGFVAGGASASRARDGEAGLREVMLADLIAVLERHPLYCRSAQLYALHALAGQPGPQQQQQQGQQGGGGGK